MGTIYPKKALYSISGKGLFSSLRNVFCGVPAKRLATNKGTPLVFQILILMMVLILQLLVFVWFFFLAAEKEFGFVRSEVQPPGLIIRS